MHSSSPCYSRRLLCFINGGAAHLVPAIGTMEEAPERKRTTSYTNVVERYLRNL